MIDREKLAALERDGWIKSQQHPEADLWIYNYTPATQYAGHWTPETIACRGLILDGNGDVVARPFPKIFNYGDPNFEWPAGVPFRVQEKFDGSLGIMYRIGDGLPQLATRGSFVSEQAKEGTRMLQEESFGWDEGATPLFEIIYPENQIVVDYGGESKLVLLGCIDNETGLERSDAIRWQGEHAESHIVPEAHVPKLIQKSEANREGFVIAFDNGDRVKLKYPEYVRLHKIVTGLTERRVWDWLRGDSSVEEMLAGVPDEFYEWATGVAERLTDRYNVVEQAARDAYDRQPPADERRVVAAYFKEQAVLMRPENKVLYLTPILFAMLDGKPYEDQIWKMLKPAPKTLKEIVE